MNAIIEDINTQPFSQKFEEKLQPFNKDCLEIYTKLSGSVEKQTYTHCATSTSNIYPLMKQNEKTLLGILVGKIYEVCKRIDFQGVDFKFKGTCFIITKNMAVCSSHQLSQGQYIVRFPTFKSNIDVQVMDFYRPPAAEDLYDQIQSLDYAFLRLNFQFDLECEVQALLQHRNLSVLDDITWRFQSEIKIYGYVEDIPTFLKQGNSSWVNWQLATIIQSKGQGLYAQRSFSYNASTLYGLSGAPIIVQHQKKRYIIGIHTKGSHFHQKNYGMLFNNRFFQSLSEFQKQQQKNLNYDSFSVKPVPLMKIVKLQILLTDKMKSLKREVTKINTFQTVEYIADILFCVIQKLAELEEAHLSIKTSLLSSIVTIDEQPSKVKFLPFAMNYLTLPKTKFSNINAFLQIYQSFNNLVGFNQLKLNLLGENCLAFIIDRCLDDIKRNKFEKFPFTYFMTYLKHKILFADSQQQYSEYRKKLLENRVNIEDQSEYNSISTFQQYGLSVQRYRRKFCLICLHSSKKLSIPDIGKVYLQSLSLYRNRIIKICDLFKNIYDSTTKQSLQFSSINKFIQNKDQLEHTRRRIRGFQIYSNIQPQLMLENTKYPDFWKLNRQTNQMYTKITNYYKLEVQIEIFYALVKYQFVFCRQYFIKMKLQGNSLKQCLELGETLAKKLPNNPITTFQYLPQLQQNEQYKHRHYSSENIFQSAVFREVFIQEEAPSREIHNFSLTQVTQLQAKLYENIINILVEIKTSNDHPRGNGFLIDHQTICTARHLFSQDISLDLLKKNYTFFLLKGQIKCTITSYCLPKQQKTAQNDLIFIKFATKCNPNIQKFIPMISHENEKILKSKMKCIGLLLGQSLKENEGEITYKKSLGQIELDHNNFRHNFKGQAFLSGSPVLLQYTLPNKSQHQYVIVGVYLGQIHEEGRMSKYIPSMFDNKNFFQKIRFVYLKQYYQCLKQSIVSFIKRKYKGLDYFLLKVLGQILLLNHYGVYLSQLQLSNLIFSKENEYNVIFSQLQIDINLEKQDSQEKSEFQRRNAKAFAKFIDNLLSSQPKLFSRDEQFVKDSIIVSTIKELEFAISLTEYFFKNIDSRYVFSRKTFQLQSRQKQQLLVQIQPVESKYTQALILDSIQYIQRLNVAFRILKDHQIKTHSSLMTIKDNYSSQMQKDFWRLHDLNCDQTNIDENDINYFPYHFLKKSANFLCRKIFSNGLLNFRIFESTLRKKQNSDLFLIMVQTKISSTTLSGIDKYYAQQYLLRRFDLAYQQAKTWDFIAEILELKKCFIAT